MTGAVVTLALAASLPAYAVVSESASAVGVANAFPTTANGGALGIDSSAPAGAVGLTIQGATAQGVPAAGGVWGETFFWNGANNSSLNAIDFVITGSGGAGAYQPVLFDLGTSLFNTTASQFNIGAQVNLFSALSFGVGGTGTKSFVELDFSGADSVNLLDGHSYAFGVVDTSSPDITIGRSGGGASDPNGDGWTATSIGASADNASPFSGAVRNIFIGVYATPAPEPSSFALLGLGALASVSALRRRKA